MSEEIKAEKAEKHHKPARKTVEEWATEKGFLPQFYAGKNGAVTATGTALAGKAPKANKNFWKYRAAKAGQGWVEGFEATENEFDRAIAKACGGTIR